MNNTRDLIAQLEAQLAEQQSLIDRLRQHRDALLDVMVKQSATTRTPPHDPLPGAWEKVTSAAPFAYEHNLGDQVLKWAAENPSPMPVHFRNDGMTLCRRQDGSHSVVADDWAMVTCGECLKHRVKAIQVEVPVIHMEHNDTDTLCDNGGISTKVESEVTCQRCIELFTPPPAQPAFNFCPVRDCVLREGHTGDHHIVLL